MKLMRITNAPRASPLCSRLLLTLFCLAGLASPCLAQKEETPKRGYQPGGSYSIGDIETINTTNGNLMLRLPLAKLPAGRGGSTGPGVTLWYNSKLWDSRVEYRHVQSLGGEITPDPNNPNSNLIPINLLRPVGSGGWHLGFGYALEVSNREEDQYPVGEMPCTLDSSYVWKVTLVAPHGGSHDMRPLGYSDFGNNGHFQVNPNGRVTQRAPVGGGGCSSNSFQATTTGMTYESADGTNLRLVIGHDNDGSWGTTPGRSTRRTGAVSRAATPRNASTTATATTPRSKASRSRTAASRPAS
jgi:hypothetical protein